eukprot:CAMPEP_0114461780 /NCGR_PEP_ID=MMETSP0104-20121206/6464_1 /TAXON_ID=37642 ORGANISM="Paraphysomonas imperforata, Strain PA2" /NCGR_SAMPLE_ID=MMETSP0104 /ASSEMBLY_ACC=CAM_ASM_000202 /LENGTH=345 /DNA_ID=CAMNT_0001634587 /DNA_START=47 /DNA_END=1084 /DNA_ORIENTATION=-
MSFFQRFSTVPTARGKSEHITPDHLSKEFFPRWRGIVKKEGHMVKNIKERYFVIVKDLMLYYKSEKEWDLGMSPRGSHVVEKVSKSADEKTITVDGRCGKVFKLFNPNKQDSTFFDALQQAAEFSASSEHITKYAGHKTLQQAISLSQAGFIQECISILTTLVATKKVEATAQRQATSQHDLFLYLYHLGTAHLVNDNYLVSSQCLQQAVNIQRNNERDSVLLRQSDVSYTSSSDITLMVECMANLSSALYFSGETDQAIHVLEEALLVDPKCVTILNNMVVLLSNDTSGDAIDRADVYMQRALQIQRSDPRLYITYADFMLSVQNKAPRLVTEFLFESLDAVPE